jgi:hypothetical protein
MDRAHDQPARQRDGARDRQAAAQTAREEVVEILADALWSLICAGKGPRAARGASGGDIGAQPMETTGV